MLPAGGKRTNRPRPSGPGTRAMTALAARETRVVAPRRTNVSTPVAAIGWGVTSGGEAAEGLTGASPSPGALP